MDSKHIETLLEKYWKCESTLEEEQELRAFFKGSVIPEQVKNATDLFRYFNEQRSQAVAPSFDEQLKHKMNTAKLGGKVVKMMFNYARIAAGVVVVIAASYFVRQEIKKTHPDEVVDTYSDPKLAFEETKKALRMISKGFGKAQRETSKIKMFKEAELKIQNKKEEGEGQKKVESI